MIIQQCKGWRSIIGYVTHPKTYIGLQFVINGEQVHLVDKRGDQLEIAKHQTEFFY